MKDGWDRQDHYTFPLPKSDKMNIMSIEDWTLLSDHFLTLIKDINSLIAYQSRDLSNLRASALDRVINGMNEITSYMNELQSSEQSTKEEE